MDIVYNPSGYGSSDRSAAPFFVSDAPGDNAGVVSVTIDHFSDKLERLGVGTELAGFLQHQNSHLIADAQHRRGGGVVGSADGVEAELLEPRDAPTPEFVRYTYAYSRRIQMDIGALKEHLRPIQKKALIRIENCGADAVFLCYRVA